MRSRRLAAKRSRPTRWKSAAILASRRSPRLETKRAATRVRSPKRKPGASAPTRRSKQIQSRPNASRVRRRTGSSRRRRVIGPVRGPKTPLPSPMRRGRSAFAGRAAPGRAVANVRRGAAPVAKSLGPNTRRRSARTSSRRIAARTSRNASRLSGASRAKRPGTSSGLPSRTTRLG